MQKEELKKKLLDLKIFENNEWLDKYCELIEKNSSILYNKLTSQHHHIIPNFCSKILKLKKDNSQNNIVNLLYKDHILAHYYLSKFIENTYFSNAFSAVLFLIRDNGKFRKFDINCLEDYQRTYEKFKKFYFQDETIRKKKSESLKGLKRSQETKNLISKNSKGKRRVYSEKAKIHHSESLKGNKNRLGKTQSWESRNKISLHNKGKPKPSVSQKLSGVPKSKKHKEHMSKARKGKILDEKTKMNMSISQLHRNPNTRAYKWIYYYKNLSFRGRNNLLKYLKEEGFNLSSTNLTSILNNRKKAKYYNELHDKITKKESKEFKWN